MELGRLMNAFDYKVTDGSPYLWKCYPNARFMNFESEYAYVSVIHCTTSNVVYEVTIDTSKSNNDTVSPHRWINPDYVDDLIDETESRNIDHTIAWDNVQYVDVEDFDKFLIKAKAIFNGFDLETEESSDLQLVLVDTVSTFRMRYLVEVPVGIDMFGKDKKDWALDTVTMEEAVEFSQLHLGEQIVSHRVITKDEAIALCDQDNEYAAGWTDKLKIETFITPWKESLND